MLSRRCSPIALVVLALLASALLAGPGLLGAPSAAAAPSSEPSVSIAADVPLTVTTQKIGWNVVGLDSNRVTIGPNQFPNGVRICNNSGSTMSGQALWTWLDSTHQTYIYLDSPGTIDWTLANGACRSIYWTIEVKRDSASYFKTRNFKIDVTSTSPAGSRTIVDNQQIYVEKLVSQNRNVVGSITGPGIAPDTTQVLVGEEYTYTLTGATAPGGYEQLEFAAIFDPSFFEVLEVRQVYGANTAPSRVPTPNEQMYADACLWENDPTSPKYRSCLSTGKAGGNMTSTFRVKIIGQGTSKLNTLIYDFSGSSYHYNADYGFGPEITTIIPALEVTKTASASTYAAAGNSITFSITVRNTGDDTLTNVTVDDTTTRILSTGTNSTNGGTCTLSPAGATLSPGQSKTCSITYSVSSNDVTAGAFTNTATARATGQTSGLRLTDTSSVSLTLAQSSTRITVSKVAEPTVFTSADD